MKYSHKIRNLQCLGPGIDQTVMVKLLQSPHPQERSDQQPTSGSSTLAEVNLSVPGV